MASLRSGGVNETIRLSVAKGLTKMVRESNIRRFRNAVVKPDQYDLKAKKWVLSTKVYRLPELVLNINDEFNVANAYGDLMRYCQGKFSDVRRGGVKIEDFDDHLFLTLPLSSGPLLYSIEELQRTRVLRIEPHYASLDEIWQQFQTADTFVLTQLLMSRLEVKSGELSASSDHRGGYTEIGIEFYESPPYHFGQKN